jgi:hypothetical protein
MKKKEIIRLILMPVAFIGVVLFALLMPTGARYVGAEDILAVEIMAPSGENVILATRAEIGAFVEWLNLTVPPAEMYFVRDTDNRPLDGADFRMVADQTPDGMKGIEDGETFAYSIYHMYVYVADGMLYYNGAEYEMTPEAVGAIEGLLGEITE